MAQSTKGDVYKFEFLFQTEGMPSHFTVTLDGLSLVTVSYNRDALSPLYPPEESTAVKRLVERFESLLCKKIEAAVSQLFVEAMEGHRKQPAAFFEMLSKIDDVKKRVGIKRGREPKLSTVDLNALYTRYEELHAGYSEWKQLHDEAREQKSYSRITLERWRARWSETVRKSSESGMPIDLLERLSDPDSYISSPSEVAYEHLSRESPYKVEYLKKILSRVRRGIKRPRKKVG